MKCRNCEHFKVLYPPLKCGSEIYDSGMVACDKFDLVADYTSTQKLNRLECVEGKEK